MNFYFEMAINILEVTLILSFLVQYFGYRIKYPAKYIWTIIIGLVSFCNIAFSHGTIYMKAMQVHCKY